MHGAVSALYFFSDGRGLPSAQVLSHDLPLIHVDLLMADDLIVLMAFAGKQYYITGAGLVNSPADGFPPVTDDFIGGALVFQAGRISSMMAMGSSVRGLSLVMIT